MNPQMRAMMADADATVLVHRIVTITATLRLDVAGPSESPFWCAIESQHVPIRENCASRPPVPSAARISRGCPGMFKDGRQSGRGRAQDAGSKLNICSANLGKPEQLALADPHVLQGTYAA